MQTLHNCLSSSSLRLQSIANEQSGGHCFKQVAQCSLTLGASFSGRFSVSSLGNNALAYKIPQALTRKAASAGVVAMASSDVAAGYAVALADLANSKKALEAVNRDMDKLSALLKKQELFDFLANPVVVDEKKKSILKTLSDDANFQEYTLNFLYLLVDRKRLDIIQDIISAFEEIYNNLTDTQVATVTSAVKIESSQLVLIAKKIRSLSGAKSVRLKNVLDPTLIAGFIVKYGKDGSRFIDLSVKGQLERIAAQLDFSEKVGTF
ncbi:hypothetical protein O6H91_Y139000 [Diphasiastrum complanatum]|nr:hypothetical protein O6H91_Y139000 [Diphasiastrum complanatum]